MEIIESFVLDNRSRALPFYIELAGITYPDANYEIHRECSEFYVLEYIIDGGGYVNVNGKTFYASAGDVYLLPLGCKCHYYSDPNTPFTKIWMNVNGELCAQLLRTYNLTSKYHFENVDLYSKFATFLDICKDRTKPNNMIFSSCSTVFFDIIQTLYNHNHNESNINEYVLKAKHYCDMNIYEKIAVADVANEVSLSVSQLNRLFKKDFGTTVYSYILNCRIELSKSLLKGTAMPVSQISDRLNFADEHYFSNIFKKKTGVSPSEYRKKTDFTPSLITKAL